VILALAVVENGIAGVCLTVPLQDRMLTGLLGKTITPDSNKSFGFSEQSSDLATSHYETNMLV
jgi:hypothetical protein